MIKHQVDTLNSYFGVEEDNKQCRINICALETTPRIRRLLRPSIAFSRIIRPLLALKLAVSDKVR